MSRFRYYFQSLVSGYLVLVINIFYTLFSVPLALHFLSDAQFGLWALATQIGFYIALLDFGLSAAASRIFIDYKDHRESSEYGEVVQTTIVVNWAQAFLVILAGSGLAFVLAPLLQVPDSLQPVFRVLVLGQCAAIAIGFTARIFLQILTAHQRLDVINYSVLLGFIANFSALWLSLKAGADVYGLIWAQGASVVASTLVTAAACWKLGLWPAMGLRGGFRRDKFIEIFAYGKDVFLFALGSLLINASQVIVVSRTLGLEAAAAWSVCTRAFTVLIQLVGRIIEFAGAPLSEMFVRRENERMLRRFRELTVMSTSAAVGAAIVFACCNRAFVTLWVGKDFVWPALNDVLLAIWFVFLTTQRCHIAILGVMKDLHTAKYVYFAEGATFVILASVIGVRWGFPAIIGASIVCTGLFSFYFGLRKSRQNFGFTASDLWLRWFAPSVRVALVGIPVALVVFIVTGPASPLSQFLIRAGVVSSACGIALWRWGIPRDMQIELLNRSPSILRPALMVLGPAGRSG